METQECLNCSNTFTGNYCNKCGEKVYHAHDKSLGHLLEEVLHFFTHVEGKFFKSLKAMLTSPGQMACDYCRGLRKKYFKPVSLYILLVVIYLIFPLMQGLNMPLESYGNQPMYGNYAKTAILEKQQYKAISLEELTHQFEKKSVKISKILLVVVLPLCALALLFLWRSKKGFYFFDHFILSAEINSFFLLLQFFFFPFIIYLLVLMFGRSIGVSHTTELVILPFSLLIMIFYTTKAFVRMYKVSLLHAIIKGTGFCLIQYLVVFILYKFLLFVTVMALI